MHSSLPTNLSPYKPGFDCREMSGFRKNDNLLASPVIYILLYSDDMF